jgi:hypothetical protein
MSRFDGIGRKPSGKKSKRNGESRPVRVAYVQEKTAPLRHKFNPFPTGTEAPAKL